MLSVFEGQNCAHVIVNDKEETRQVFEYLNQKDTEVMEGAEDEIGADMERARVAADKLGDKSLSDIGGNAQTTTDEKER